MFKGIPKKKKEKIFREKDPFIWNTNTLGGWERYKKKTEENEKLKEAVISSEGDVNKAMKNLTKEMTELKYKCFGKVLHRLKVTTEEKEVDRLQKIKCKKSNEIER